MADQAALAELDALAWSADSGFPSTMPTGTPDVTFFSASNPPEAHLVAELDGRVAGYIRLKPPTHLPENGHVMQVQGLAVHPDARRRGVAAGLLDAAEETLRGRGTRKLTLRVLSTNQAAICLYERQGFVREGTLLEEFCINGRYVDDVMMDEAGLRAYLDRIGADRPAVLDGAALAALHRAHQMTVPFENLSIHLAEPISLG